MKFSYAFSYAVVLACLTGTCRFASAENICNETVPANRMVDGFPAYAQCSTSTAAVYSNNGIDTRAVSGGAGWIQTQGRGGYQCTEFAHRYLRFQWNVASVPGGNAGTWGDNTLPNGLVKTTAPVHGDIIVFAPGSCGASSTTGHVAVVDVVNANSTVAIVEQNSASRRTCQISCAKCFIHASANNTPVVYQPREGTGGAGRMIDLRCNRGMVSIRLNGNLGTGASICVYDLFGRKIADVKDAGMDGRTSWNAAPGLSGSFIVAVSRNNRTFCRNVVLEK